MAHDVKCKWCGRTFESNSLVDEDFCSKKCEHEYYENTPDADIEKDRKKRNTKYIFWIIGFILFFLFGILVSE